MQLQTIEFHGDQIEHLEQSGRHWLPLRRFCDALGIDPKSQRDRLADENRCPWAVGGVTTLTAIGTDGKRYEMACIDLDTLAMWLATIDSSRVAPEARARGVIYQRECCRVLRAHFFPARLAEQITGAERFRRREAMHNRLVQLIEAASAYAGATPEQHAAAVIAAGNAAVGHLTTAALPAPEPAKEIPLAPVEPRRGPPPPYPFTTIRRAIELRTRGVPLRKVSAELGASIPTIRQWVKVYGAAVGGVQ